MLDKSEYSLDDKDILGHKFTRYIGLIKYKITDLLYSLEGNIKTGDEISILTSTTSRRWSKEAIDQIVGQEYILFTRLDTLNEEDDPYRHFFSVTKYILPSPFDAVVSIVDDKAQFYQTFTTLAQRAHPSKRATYKNYTDDCYVMDKQVFLTELKKLIEQYKKLQTTATAATAPVDTDYIKVEPLDEYHVVNASYAQLSERYIIVSSDLVFKGRVIEKSEYLVRNKSYVGLIKYRISDIYFSMDDNIHKGDEISILTTSTSYRWEEDAIDQNMNGEYIIFARIDTMNDERDPYRALFPITKYCLYSPFLSVVAITEEGAKFDPIFTSLVAKAQPSTRVTAFDRTADCYLLSEQEFISELNILIEQYKEPRATSIPPDTTVSTDSVAATP